MRKTSKPVSKPALKGKLGKPQLKAKGITANQYDPRFISK